MSLMVESGRIVIVYAVVVQDHLGPRQSARSVGEGDLECVAVPSITRILVRVIDGVDAHVKSISLPRECEGHRLVGDAVVDAAVVLVELAPVAAAGGAVGVFAHSAAAAEGGLGQDRDSAPVAQIGIECDRSGDHIVAQVRILDASCINLVLGALGRCPASQHRFL